MPAGTRKVAAAKPAEERKPRAAAPSKGKKPLSKGASHPPYFEMIKEALLALKERGGSSPHAIAKYMEEKHRGVLPDNFRKTLALQLKNCTAKGKLTKIKASYKLCEVGKAKTAALKIAPAATKRPRAAAVVGKKRKAEAVKKATPKKAKKAAAPGKAKQPKSIKSPVAKRAKKVA